jgi:predicted lipid-binding transport protein (Tim44 family)
MALSMDEQRILDEIERALASADPGLATRMSSFGTRGVLTLRARRIRLLASLGTLLVVAAVSLVVYALVPFRTAADRQGAGRTGASPGAPAVMAPSRATGQPSAPASGAASSAPAGKASASPGPASASPLASGPATSKPSATVGAQPRTVRPQ